MPEKCVQKKSYDILLLLLSGDIERNPGPENWYSLRHPKMCGYFRTAIYLVFEGQKLLPKIEDDALVFVDVNDGFKDMKILFKEQFELHLIDMKTLKKNISRFKVTNQKWGRDNCDAKDEYYDTFSPTNWNKLDDLKKSKHTLFCNECSKFFCEFQAKFPSTT